jgi:hypothetical protein
MGFSYILGKKKAQSLLSDQAGGFSFGHKKALHFHVRLFVLLKLNYLCFTKYTLIAANRIA